MAPETISHYRILKKIGRGGMGEVYLAEDLTLGRKVGLKLLPPNLTHDSDRVRRLHHEARTVSALNHPNILTVHEFGREGDLHFMVTEFVEGQTLRERLAKGLTLRETAEIALPIARALGAAHASGIVHRDLKPENVMVRRDRVVKLLDFGIAHVMERSPSPTELTLAEDTGVLIGTVPYMSPEQLRLQKVDARTDIYSLGLLLYEMLTGRFAFEAPTWAEMIAAILEREPPPLPSIGDLPDDLADWVMRALNKNQEERPTLDELITILEQILRELDWKRELGRSESFRALVESQLSTARKELPHHAARPRAAAFATNLPAAMTPLIGRDSELESLGRLLRIEGTRLVTLTGPGGAGKTRLAIEAARASADAFADGVFLISLAAVSDASLVVLTIGQTLEVHEVAGRSPVDVVSEFLRPKELLLLIDNFEQVIVAAPGLAHLLGSCPRLKVMVTSQSPLHLRGEREFPVHPLTLAKSNSIKEIRSTPAVTLFVDRARDINPEFSLTERNARTVAEICSRVDGLPLAIELAAARIKVLTPEAILEKLQKPLSVLTGGPRDLPERQQTMRNTLEWSYSPLSADEKVLYARLSVFRGGCTLEAAEQVCWWDDRAADFVDTFSALVDRSLLKRDDQANSEPRFSMLETIRSFAAELLSASGEEDEVRLRHATYYAELAERAEPELAGPAEAVWPPRRRHLTIEAFSWKGSVVCGWRAMTFFAPPALHRSLASLGMTRIGTPLQIERLSKNVSSPLRRRARRGPAQDDMRR